MATRHELIHIDFVASAGKANPVLKSLQDSCERARIEKENLDRALSNAKSANAQKETILSLEGMLQKQTKIWQALQKGVREYAKGIDTLSKGIKEYNAGTLDEMPAKFNKQVYNAAKLAQSSVQTGSEHWNQLQRLMDATDRNVVRAREDIDGMMQSLKDGSSVSTVQLTRARDVLEDLSRLSVTNSEEWRGLKSQMNEVSQAVISVEETERRLKGEMVTLDDAIALSNNLTRESINLRHADGEAAMNAAKKEREGVESTMRSIQDKITLLSGEHFQLKLRIDYQDNLDENIRERDKRILEASIRREESLKKSDEANQTIKDFDEQKARVASLKKEVEDLEKARKKEEKVAEKSSEAADKHNKAVESQQKSVSSLDTEVKNLHSDMQKLDEDLEKVSREPVKPKVDSGDISQLNKELAEIDKLTSENKILDDAIIQLKKHRDELSASQEDGAVAAKKDAESMKEEAKSARMTAEEAKAAYDKMMEKSTIKMTGDKIEYSNLERAQQTLLTIFKNAGGTVSGSQFTLNNASQFNSAVKSFIEMYGIEGEKEEKRVRAIAIMKDLIEGKHDGLFERGVFREDTKTAQIKKNQEAFKSYIDTANRLLAISKGQNDVDKEQEQLIGRLGKAYKEEADKLKKRNEEYARRKEVAEAIPGPVEKDGVLTAKGKALEEAETYRERYVDKQKERERKAFEEFMSAKKGIGIESKQTTEENTTAEQEAIKVAEQRVQVEQQIEALSVQKQKNTERLSQLKEKSAEAERKQAEAAKEAASAEERMGELLRKRSEIETKLAEKKKLLEEAQKKLNEMQQQSIAGDKEETSSTEALLQKKREEYEAEKEKLGPMKEAKDQALIDRRKAKRTIFSATEEIRIEKNKDFEGDRKSEEELLKMRQRVKELGQELDKETQLFNENAQAISNLNKRETDAAIEMAQSENVSIEKVKQAIDILQKKIQTEETDVATMQARGEAINRLKDRLTDMNAEVAKLSKPIADRLTGDLGKMSETEIKQSIEAGQQLVKTYESSSTEAKTLSDAIARAESHLKQYGIEASRAKVRQEALDMQMQERMKDLPKLTDSALSETKKYWEEMVRTQGKAGDTLTSYRNQLEKLVEEENRRKQLNAESIISNMGTSSDEEIKKAIQDFEQLRDAQAHGNKEWTYYNQRVQEGKKYLEEWAKVDSVIKMEEQMSKLPTLSDAALTETKKFWEAMISGAERGSSELSDYERYLRLVAEEEKMRNQEANQKSAKIIMGDNLGMYSEAEIRESINAAKELKLHMASAEPDAIKLSDAIARAESHIKKYGIEASRAAQKQLESDEMMKKQLDRLTIDTTLGIIPSESVIKAQHQYWQRLVEDPKTASESLEYYKDQLLEVESVQRSMVVNKGNAAISWFSEGRDKYASTNQVREMAGDLKAYRDTLPQEMDAEKIKLIDDYLNKLGMSAKSASEGMMSLGEAINFAESAGKEGFLGSQQEIQMAASAIEKRRNEVIKELKEKRGQGISTRDSEEELANLTKKLRDLKFEQDNLNMSQEKMRMLMTTPTNAVNLEELRAAIKRADGELRRMEDSLGKGNNAYKEFASQVKAAKIVLKEMDGMAKATNSTWDQAISRLKSYVGVYLSFNIAQQKFVAMMGDMKTLSDKMGEVRKTTGLTADAVGRLSDNLAKMDTRTTLQDLMSVSAKAGQLGLKNEDDILGFTEAANKLMVALPEMGEEAATQIMKVALATGEVDKIRKEMEYGLTEGSSATAVALEKIGSTIDKLRANSAASAPQITDFVKRVGAVGAQSGLTIDQVAALGSTVDALGMRVEMSATALSRMIPAIRSNAFEISKAIGMTPNALRDMFNEAGGGMKAMLAIFQHIKDSGMDADSVEKLLGMGGMKAIMKDLNQQGARAGIVFAGLSQNVDVLRSHLSIAKDAYEENIAIQEEYDKMNETAAAKWERLVNHIEEVFVNNSSQSFLGTVIDGLRAIVDLLTGPLSTAVVMAGTALFAIKSGITSIPANIGKLFEYLEESALKAGDAMVKAANATHAMGEASKGVEEAGNAVEGISEALDEAEEAGESAGEMMGAATDSIQGMTSATKVSIFSVKGLKAAWKGLDTTMKANIIVAIVALLYTLAKALYDAMTETSKYSRVISEVNSMIETAIDQFNGYWNKINDTKEALDQAKKSTEGLKEGSKELAEATANVTDADNNHRAAIADINRIYGKYLGFMLTEANYADMSAAAHDKVAAAIRREMLAKQQQASIEEVSKENTDKLKEGFANLTDELADDAKLKPAQISKIKRDTQQYMRKNIKYNANAGSYDVSDEMIGYLSKKTGRKAENLRKQSTENLMAGWLYEYLSENYHLSEKLLNDITGVRKEDRGYTITNLGGRNFRGDYAKSYLSYIKDVKKVEDLYEGETSDAKKEEEKATKNLVEELKSKAEKNLKIITGKKSTDKDRNAAYEELANVLEGIDNNIDILNPVRYKDLIDSLKKQAETINKSVDTTKLKEARTRARSLFSRATEESYVEGSVIPTNPEKNPWGSKHDAASTDWKNMTAETLVSRRKQMKDFVNAIQTDTDVKGVLEQDAALQEAIKKGMSDDMRTVIEWYNTERLKIQEELQSRHLTNTGNWIDPKKERARKKRLQEEWSYYLNELDAYYTERKTRIQEAQNEEGLIEAEVQNRILSNEAEWRQRRAELQQLYADKSNKVSQEEQDAIFSILAERTEDDVKFVEKSIESTILFMKKIGEKSPSELKNALGKLDKGTEQDFMRQQQALGKHLQSIKEIIDKERPFNGIAENMRSNLTTMGILAAHMNKEYSDLMKKNADMTSFNARQSEESFRELSFLLMEAENAYSISAEELMRRAADAGMEAWVKEMRSNPEMQEGLMAQLRITFDSVQEAIKKEASLLKKTAENMWNNILLPDGKTTLKQAFDKTVAQLSIEQGRVSKANSTIGAGYASERVADKLAFKQINIQMALQDVYYKLMKKRGKEQVRILEAQAEALREQGKIEDSIRKKLDARHASMSLNLALTNEQTEKQKFQEELSEKLSDSQHRLYNELKSWSDLLSDSMKELFEAESAGNEEYYNERAKLELTGKGGPGSGTYVVIDNAGTSDASAHYEYLDERAALERQHQIEQDNAIADAWKTVLDNLNQKLNDTITDQLNAMIQKSSLDSNTNAILSNTQALYALTKSMNGGEAGSEYGIGEDGVPESLRRPKEGDATSSSLKAPWQMTDEEMEKSRENMGLMWQAYKDQAIAAETEKAEALSEIPGYEPSILGITDEQIASAEEMWKMLSEQEIASSKSTASEKLANQKMVKEGEEKADKEMVKSNKQSFSAMTAAANMYGIAYQTMTNDNLDTSQKVQMMIVQAIGSSLISILTAQLAASQAQSTAEAPSWISKTLSQLGPIGAPVAIGMFTALIGGLMGMAVSGITKSKAQIAQATGANSSASAGRISTGMLTYAEGNVNEFTDPSELTPGRHYNVEGSDGKTYRAKYTGKNARTHITTGPEFHLVGEAGREAIIDAKTTRKIQMDDSGIWNAIHTLYNGGSMSRVRSMRKGRGVSVFAGGNIDEFDDTGRDISISGTSIDMSQLTSLQSSIDRQSDLLEDLRMNGIKATFDVYGKGGLIDSYDTGKKTVKRHGERY